MKSGNLVLNVVIQIVFCQFVLAQIEVSHFNNAINYTSDNGISNNYLSDIKEDKNGFLWIATGNGVTRYDGNHFTNFQYYYENATPIKIGNINTLLIDKSGEKIWIGGSQGIFYSSMDEPHFVMLDSLSPPLDFSANGTVQDLFFDKKEYLWATKSNQGLIQFDVIKKKQKSFLFSDKTPNLNSIICISKDPEHANILWLGTLAGLVRFDFVSKDFEVFMFGNNPEMAQNRIRKIQASKNKVYLGTWGEGFVVFDKKKRLFYQPTKLKVPNEHHLVLDLYQEGIENLWITTSHGLIKYNIFSDSIEEVINHKKTKGILKGITFVDSRKILWFCSKNGLFKYDPQQNVNRFVELEERTSFQNSLDINQMLFSNGFYYAGGHNASGLYKIDPKDYSFEVIKIPTFETDAIGDNNIVDIMEMNDGKFLILLFQRILIYDPVNQNFELSPLQIPHSSPVMRDVVKDKNGNYWIGTRHAGLFCFNYENSTIDTYKEGFNDGLPVNYTWIEHLFIDSLDRLWIRTAAYFSVMDLNTRSIQNMRSVNNGFVFDNVGWFQEDYKGNMLITGHRDGLGIINPKDYQNGVKCHIDGDFYKLFKRNDSLFWTIGNNNNLGELNTSTMFHRDIVVNSTHKKVKLRGPFINIGKGEFLIGCKNGIVIYDAEKKEINKEIPAPYVRKVTVNGKTEYEGNSLAKKDFNFENDTKQIIINISSLGFHESDQITYQYKMNQKWIDLGVSQEINFTNLAYGKYNLKLRALNSKGFYNETPVDYNFIIRAPWYLTWWVYVLYVFGFLLTTIWIIRSRSARLQKEKDFLEIAVKVRTNEIIEKNKQLESQAKQLKEMDTIKSRFFANISHEFRTPITLIKGPISNYLKKENKEEKLSIEKLEMIDRNADRLLRLVNQLLDLSKLDSGEIKLEHKEGDVYYFLRALSSSYSSYAEQRNITYLTDISDQNLNAIFDHDKLEKIVFNLLSNAFKYTSDNSEVKFAATVEHNQLKLTVSDTGKGISKDQLPYIFDRFYQVDNSSTRDQEGSGIGLSLIKELVTLMKGTIDVKSTIDLGTIFIITLPIEITENEIFEKEIIEVATSPEVKMPFANEKRETASVLSKEVPMVLIIEDNEDMRKYIADHLRQKYKILEAIHGLAGLETGIKEIPDLIITDLMMPHLNGISLCKKLKSDTRTSHIPIIMLTAKAQKDTKIQGLTEGADEYLTKPFDSDELKIRVDNLIQQRKKLRELYSQQLTLEPRQIQVTSLDESFLNSVIEIVETHLSDPEFGVFELQGKIAMSRTQLHRKMKSLTNQAPGEFLRNYRLKRAVQILSNQGENITQVAYTVGFNSPSYFAKCFKKVYGESPSDFLQRTLIESTNK